MADQTEAAALAAMSVADLVAHIELADLDTLKDALALERAGANREGAVAALTAAIDGHPELAASAANGAGELQDDPSDPDAVSVAPARPHQSLVDQLDLRWGEMKHFVRGLEGTVDGELGDVLTFVRSKL